MKETILAHVTAHPSMTEQDMIKLCYQAVFGAEHLLTDRAKAWAYFEYEWNNTPEKEIPLFEPLSIRYARIHLAAWKHQRLPADWLFRIFYMTASSPSGASDSDLNTLLDVIDELADQKSLPFAAAEWRAARNNYLRNGGGAVHRQGGDALCRNRIGTNRPIVPRMVSSDSRHRRSGKRKVCFPRKCSWCSWHFRTHLFRSSRQQAPACKRSRPVPDLRRGKTCSPYC